MYLEVEEQFNQLAELDQCDIFLMLIRRLICCLHEISII